MSFINRKITSRATFAVFLTATILASCSSDDSSSTGRLKNAGVTSTGEFCFDDEAERSQLLISLSLDFAPPPPPSPSVPGAILQPSSHLSDPNNSTNTISTIYNFITPINTIPNYINPIPIATIPISNIPTSTNTIPNTNSNITNTVPNTNSIVNNSAPTTSAPETSAPETSAPNNSITETSQSQIPISQVSNPPVSVEDLRKQFEKKYNYYLNAPICGETITNVQTTIPTDNSTTDNSATDSTTAGTDTSVTAVAAPSGPSSANCINGEDKYHAIAGYDEQIKVHENDADLSWYNNLLNGRNNLVIREVCTGTEVNKVILLAVQTKSDQPTEQASVPAAVLTVEKPVVLLNDSVTEVVVEPTEVKELVTSAGFVEGTVEMQVESAEGFSDWLMVDPASSNTVAVGKGSKSIKYRVTSKDKSQPVVEKTVEIQRLPESTAIKIDTANQLTVAPTVEVETSSGSKIFIWVALLVMILILILAFGMQKKKKNDANPPTTPPTTA